MEKTISIDQLARAIQRLPSDQPRVQSRVWYKTQKEHWLGWLREYDGPGAYGRMPGNQRDARFAYNHIVCPEMLLWLIEASGVQESPIEDARRAYATGTTQMQKSGAIRRCVPWSEVCRALWG